MAKEAGSNIFETDLSDEELLELMTFKTRKATYFITDIQSFSSGNGTSYVHLRDDIRLVVLSDDVVGRLKLQKAKVDLYIRTMASAKEVEHSLKREFIADMFAVVKESLEVPVAALTRAEEAIATTQTTLENVISSLPEIIAESLSTISAELEQVQSELNASAKEAVLTTERISESAKAINEKAEVVSGVVEVFEQFIEEVETE